MTIRIKQLSRQAINVILGLSIGAIAFVTYRDILGYYFTAEDTFTLIETSRIQSLSDVGRIFSEPLMNGTSFTTMAKFYRPIGVLSYSFDYFIWGLNPFGYNLTNLILQIAVSALVFYLITSLTNGDKITAWLGAVLFTIHPILVEDVPTPERRQDLMASLFVLLSFLLFVKCHKAKLVRNRYVILSLASYALALGSKEIAVVLPLLLVTYLVLPLSNDEFAYSKLGRAAVATLPYLIMTAAFIVLRHFILGGVGGYANKSFLAMSYEQIVHRTGRTLWFYFTYLLYPIDFLRSPFSPVPNMAGQVLSAIIAAGGLIMLFHYRKAIISAVTSQENKKVGILKISLVGMIVLSLLGMIAYPFFCPAINELMLQAYQGKGLAFLTSMMRGRDTFPAELYLHKANNAFFGSFFFVFILSTASFLIIDQRYCILSYFNISDRAKILWFSFVWLALPLAVSLLTLTFVLRMMYMPAIPYCIALAVILVELSRSVLRDIGIRRASRSVAWLPAMSTGAAFVIVCGLSISLLLYSPLMRKYKDWEESGKFTRLYLHKLSDIVSKVPDNTVLKIFGLPEHPFIVDGAIWHVKSVSIIGEYSIQSWLNLNYPGKRIQVARVGKAVPTAPLHGFDLVSNADARGGLSVFLRSDNVRN